MIQNSGKIVLFFSYFLFISFCESFAQKKIEWDQKSLQKISSSHDGMRYCGYARMKVLRNGSWLCVYEADGNIIVIKSKDAGVTWSPPIVAARKTKEINMAVPELLETADGSILLMYNLRPTVTGQQYYFAIKTKKSYDGGLTWKHEKVLYEAGNEFKDGCWEPAALQLPSGEIQLFFANEGIYTKSEEQNISMLKSFDNGVTWTKMPQIISFRSGSRDGMPVPLLLPDKKVLLAIEDNGNKNFKPYILQSLSGETWGNTIDAGSDQRNYALKKPIHDSIYAGAPYLCRLKNGEVLLSYQGTEGRRNKMEYADMKVVIGDDEGQNFDSKSVPFKIPEKKFALWNSLMVTPDDIIVALTSTNAYSDGQTEVWMIKGRLLSE